MKHTTKKWLALLMSLIMLVSLFPTAAFADAEQQDADEPLLNTSVEETVEEEIEPAAEEPAAEAEEPAAETEEPAAETEEPAAETEEPAAETEEPAAEAEEPAAEAEEPAVEAEEPAAEEDEPVLKPDEADEPLELYVEGQVVTAQIDGTGRSSYEMLTGLVEGMFYGTASPQGDSGRSRLSSYDQNIYDKLRSQVEDVALNGGSTAFEIPADQVTYPTSWTEDDLWGPFVIDGAINPTIVEFLDQILAFDGEAIVHALLADCPYEMYWFGGGEYSWGSPGYGVKTVNGESVLYLTGSYSFTLPVSVDYRSGEYVVDATEAQRAATAAAKAQTVVENCADYGDEAKLNAYKDYICDWVEYNDAAADPDMNTPYGDPWQMVYVFDEDPDTDVVCEGYSKAFQYLCDQSSFANAQSRLVSGDMRGGTGGGAHMWNVVELDGGRYLVDVTNCDEGTIGYPDQLFLAAPVSGSYSDGYVFDCSGNSITYTYDADTMNLFGENLLTLSADSSETPEAVEIEAGETKTARIDNAGDSAWFKFTPEEDGVYIFSSAGDRDTMAYLYDSYDTCLDQDDDSGGNSQFKLAYQMTAGETYYYEARYYSDDETGRFPVQLSDVIDATSCGDDARWSFDAETGVLTISGTGSVWWFSDEYDPDLGNSVTTGPWADVAYQITEIVIGEGITEAYINGYPAVETVRLPASFSNGGIYTCPALTDIYYDDTLQNYIDNCNLSFDPNILEWATVHCTDYDAMRGSIQKTVNDDPPSVTLTAIAQSETGSELSYQWYAKDESWNDVPIEGATGQSYVVTADSPRDPDGNYRYRCEITASNGETLSLETYVNATELLGDNYCGNDITWSFEDGVLTLSGTGETWNYNTYWDDDLGREVSDAPWSAYSFQVTRVTVGEGITGAYDGILACLPNVTAIDLPAGLTYANIFRCPALIDIYYNDSLANYYANCHLNMWEPGKEQVTIHCLDGETLQGSIRQTVNDDPPSVTLTVVATNAGEGVTLSCRWYYPNENWNDVLVSEEQSLVVTKDSPRNPNGYYYYRCEITASDGGCLNLETTVNARDLAGPDACGDDARWSFDAENGILTISGSGSLWYCWEEDEETGESYSSAPWAEFADQVKEIVVEDGITSLKSGAVCSMPQLTKMTVGASMQEINVYGCDALKDLYYGGTCEQFGDVDTWTDYGEFTDRISVHCTDGDLLKGTIEMSVNDEKTAVTLTARVKGVSAASLSYQWDYYTQDEDWNWTYLPIEGATDQAYVVTLESPGEFDGEYKFRCRAQAADGRVLLLTSGWVRKQDLCGLEACGDDATWSFENGVLTISGSGTLWSYTWTYPAGSNSRVTTAPWADVADQITGIELADGITSVGRYTFCCLPNLSSFTGGAGLKSLSSDAFERDSKLKTVTLPVSFERIDYHVFDEQSSLTIHFGGTMAQWTAVTQNGYDDPPIEYYNSSLRYAVIVCTDGTIGAENANRCGDDAWWRFENGTLFITGTGAVDDWVNEGGWTAPWADKVGQIKTVRVEEDITELNSGLLYESSDVKDVYLPASMEAIYNAFLFCEDGFTIHYAGTKAQWGAIEVGLAWPCAAFLRAKVVCSDGTIAAKTNLCGSNATWSYNASTKTLTITGSGEVWPFDTSIYTPFGGEQQTPTTPWASMAAQVEKLVLDDGIYSVMHNAFNKLVNLKQVTLTLPTPMEEGDASAFVVYLSAFGRCTKLTDVYINASKERADDLYINDDNVPLLLATQHYNDGDITYATSGQCGEEISWALDTATGILTVSGTGPMYDYERATYENQTPYLAPWTPLRSMIKAVVVEDGVTRVGDCAFYNCWRAESVELGDTVESIGEWAFAYSSSLYTLRLPASLVSIERGAFINYYNFNTVIYAGAEEQWLLIDIAADNEPLENAENFVVLPKLTYRLEQPVVGVTAGKTLQLKVLDEATGKPVDSSVKLEWSSSNTAVATVSKTGLVKGVGVGEAEITVRTKDGSYSEICIAMVMFSDVADSSKFYFDPVYWAFFHKPQITTGTTPATFSPDNGCTRGQIVTFLWRANGCPEPTVANPFKDIKSTDFCYKAVLWAYENGITTGTTATTFSPNNVCTREQCVTFLWRAAGKPAAGGKTNFKDVISGKFYEEAVSWAYNNGVTTGITPTMFGVGRTCTRGQIVTFIYRYMNP